MSRRYRELEVVWMGQELERIARLGGPSPELGGLAAVERLQESIEILRASGCSLEIVAMHLRDLGFRIEGVTLGNYLRTIRARAAGPDQQTTRRRSSRRSPFSPLWADPRRPMAVADLERELTLRVRDPAVAYDDRSCAEVEAELDRFFDEIDVAEAPDQRPLSNPAAAAVEPEAADGAVINPAFDEWFRTAPR